MFTFLRSCMTDVGPEFPSMNASKYLKTTSTRDVVRQPHSSSGNIVEATERTVPSTDLANNQYGFRDLPSSANASSNINAIAYATSSQEIASATGRDQRKQPIKNKRSLDSTNHLAALHNGADTIEKIAKASRKRTRTVKETLSSDEQNSLISLSSMVDTEPHLKRRFIHLSRMQALPDLEK